MTLLNLFHLFSKPSVSPIEEWATSNAKKATPDDLIAGVIVQSFAKDFKHWKFGGEFNQRHASHSGFTSTTLSRKVTGKKHIEIVFVFIRTSELVNYSTIFKYKVVGCEVNGIPMTDAAFRYIYTNWNNIVVQVRRAEQVAAEAKASMQINESKWDLAEELLRMKRNGLGVLVPIKTVEESGQ